MTWSKRWLREGVAVIAIYTPVSTTILPPASAQVTDLVSIQENQIKLTWSVPSSASSITEWHIKYSTTGPLLTEGDYNSAPYSIILTTSGLSPSQSVGASVTGLIPAVTHYFAIKSSSTGGLSPLDTSSPEPQSIASYFGQAIEPAGATGPGLGGSVAWGDFDNDGDLDIAVNGLELNFEITEIH